MDRKLHEFYTPPRWWGQMFSSVKGKTKPQIRGDQRRAHTGHIYRFTWVVKPVATSPVTRSQEGCQGGPRTSYRKGVESEKSDSWGNRPRMFSVILWSDSRSELKKARWVWCQPQTATKQKDEQLKKVQSLLLMHGHCQGPGWQLHQATEIKSIAAGERKSEAFARGDSQCVADNGGKSDAVLCGKEN